MTQQLINVGTVAGDNTGDPGRTAFQKVNANFTEIYTSMLPAGASYADKFTATGGQTAFTLSGNPGSLNNLDVSLDGATLVPGVDYSWSSTTLTLTVGATAGQTLLARYSIYVGSAPVVTPGSVSTAQLADLSVTTAKIAANAVTTAKLGAASVTATELASSAVVDASLASSSQIYAVNQTYNRTAAEISAGVTPTNYGYPPGDVRRYGADPTGSADSTTAIQAAITACCGSAVAVYLPSGTYKCGALTATARFTMYGDGMYKSTISSTVTGTTDGFTINPPTAGGGNTGYLLRDFGITNAVSGNGRYGLRVTLGTNAYMSNSDFVRVYIGTFGNQGIYLDNSIVNADGFFTMTISRCWITNGILGADVGDSINIEENTITGSANYIGVNLSSNTGARQIVVASNNISTLGGGVYLNAVYGATIRNNQIEYGSTTINYPGSNTGYVTIKDCLHTTIEENTITPNIGGGVTVATSALAITGTSKRTYIRTNEISQGQTYHISSEATTDMSFLYQDNRYNTVNPVFNFLGTDTRGVWLTPTLLNSWVNTGGTWGNVQYQKSVDGIVTLTGALSSGSSTFFNLPAAFSPANTIKFLTAYDGSTTPAFIQVNTSGGGGGVIATSSPGNIGIHLEGVTYRAAFTN